MGVALSMRAAVTLASCEGAGEILDTVLHHALDALEAVHKRITFGVHINGSSQC